VEEIDTSSFKERVFSKTKFSMVIPEVEEQLKQLKVENIVLMGIEVCVLGLSIFHLQREHTYKLMQVTFFVEAWTLQRNLYYKDSLFLKMTPFVSSLFLHFCTNIEDTMWPHAESISYLFASFTHERYLQHSKIKLVSPSDHIMFYVISLILMKFPHKMQLF